MKSKFYYRPEYMNEPLLKVMKKAEPKLSIDSTGHDFFHSLRVMHLAYELSKDENIPTDALFLAALLHDYYRTEEKLVRTLHYSREAMFMLQDEFGPLIITLYGVKILEEVIDIIMSHEEYHQYENQLKSLSILQDADRLDAIGYTGIARTFMFAGSHGGSMYKEEDFTKEVSEVFNPATDPKGSSCLAHYHSKLSRLAQGMNTLKGKELAMIRQKTMDDFFMNLTNELTGTHLNK